MTIIEAKEAKRYWLQNSYKYKGEEMPANIAEALKILGEFDPNTAVNPPPPLAEPVIEWEKPAPPVTKKPATVNATPKLTGKPIVLDELALELAHLNAERAGASKERIKQINAACSAIYFRRSHKKKADKRTANSTKIPQKISRPASTSAEKLAPFPTNGQNGHSVIPQNPPKTPPPIVQTVNANDLQRLFSLFSEVLNELARGEAKHFWPEDVIHQAAVVGEEAGELLRATLQYQLEKTGSLEAVRTEAIQTCATCIRLLKNLPACI